MGEEGVAAAEAVGAYAADTVFYWKYVSIRSR